MSLHLLSSRQIIILALCVAAWALLFVLIWLPRRPRKGDQVGPFNDWKQRTGLPWATYTDFIESGDSPGSPLTRRDLTIVVLFSGILIFYVMLMSWGVIN